VVVLVRPATAESHQRASTLLESCRLAPVKRTASGTPRPSQITWRLLPRFARSVGFGPVSSPPHVARTEQLSTTARDQSIWSWRASQSNSAKCISSQMPASCQSRSRRQHVIPEPQRSSCGNICHGIPLRRTKRMPVRHARSETRGRPPFSRRGESGTNGSTRSHKVSGSSVAVIGSTLYAEKGFDSHGGRGDREVLLHVLNLV
jgi:hypothetical protein